jgi:hypothetical protein
MKRFSLVLLVLFSLAAGPAPAQQYSNQLKKLLIDLPGWNGEDPEGADMSFNQITMITAARAYNKGNATLNVGIIIGGASNVDKIPKTTYETEEGFLRIEKVKGYDTYISYNKKDKSGSIFVLLATNPHSGILTFTFEGIDWSTALDLAKKYDWDAMKKVAESIK